MLEACLSDAAHIIIVIMSARSRTTPMAKTATHFTPEHIIVPMRHLVPVPVHTASYFGGDSPLNHMMSTEAGFPLSYVPRSASGYNDPFYNSERSMHHDNYRPGSDAMRHTASMFPGDGGGGSYHPHYSSYSNDSTMPRQYSSHCAPPFTVPRADFLGMDLPVLKSVFGERHNEGEQGGWKRNALEGAAAGAGIFGIGSAAGNGIGALLQRRRSAAAPVDAGGVVP